MKFIRAIFVTCACLLGSVGFAQTASNSMTATVDGAQTDMLMSPEFVSAQSRWSTMEVPAGGPINFVDEIYAVGYVMDGDAIATIVTVYFNVWSVGGELRIEQPSIDVTVQGDTGRWDTTDEDEVPVITLTTYERTDSTVLVEATFTGNPVYWATIYKKDEDRGPAKAVQGSFSIQFPVE